MIQDPTVPEIQREDQYRVIDPGLASLLFPQSVESKSMIPLNAGMQQYQQIMNLLPMARVLSTFQSSRPSAGGVSSLLPNVPQGFYLAPTS